jgi:hypothetical protein
MQAQLPFKRMCRRNRVCSKNILISSAAGSFQKKVHHALTKAVPLAQGHGIKSSLIMKMSI